MSVVTGFNGLFICDTAAERNVTGKWGNHAWAYCLDTQKLSMWDQANSVWVDMGSLLTLPTVYTKVSVSAGSSSLLTTGYLSIDGVLSTSVLGFRAIRSGSIMAISGVATLATTTAGTLQFASRINGSNKLTATTASYAALATNTKGVSATATAGTHAFAAGDIINIFATFGGVVVTASINCNVEIQYD